MSDEERIAIACDADLRINTAIGRKIASELTIEEAIDISTLLHPMNEITI